MFILKVGAKSLNHQLTTGPIMTERNIYKLFSDELVSEEVTAYSILLFHVV
jgi:hypothetical protein